MILTFYNKIIIISFCMIMLFFFNSCTPQFSTSFLSSITETPPTEKLGNVCSDKSNYIPDPNYLSHTPDRVVKVNFHFIQNSQGKANFNEKEGIECVDRVLSAANGNLWYNQKMLLPKGNDTPVIPARYKYELTPDPNDPDDDGIYFHQDDDFYYLINRGKDRNNYNQDVFKKYGIQKNEVLNIFVQDHHLDSLKSETYKDSMTGIAFKTWVKCGMWYSAENEVVIVDGVETYPKRWLAHKQMNHEIGHVFSLGHTWAGNDGCEDTPNHSNCWERTTSPPCNEYSNNIMDYNPLRNAFTPCQIGRVHYTLTNRDIKRNLLKRTWCAINQKPIVIKKDFQWNSCKDLESHIVVESGNTLTIRCRVSLPKDAKIEVLPGAKLIIDGGRLHNDCGEQWQGIEIHKMGRNEGQVQLMNGGVIENTVHPIDIKRIVQKP